MSRRSTSHLCAEESEIPLTDRKRTVIAMLDELLFNPCFTFADNLLLVAGWEGRSDIAKYLQAYSCNPVAATGKLSELVAKSSEPENKLLRAAIYIDQRLKERTTEKKRYHVFLCRLENLHNVIDGDKFSHDENLKRKTWANDINFRNWDGLTYDHCERLLTELILIYINYVDVLDEILKMNGVEQIDELQRVIKERIMALQKTVKTRTEKEGYCAKEQGEVELGWQSAANMLRESDVGIGFLDVLGRRTELAKNEEENVERKGSRININILIKNWCASRYAIADDLIKAKLVKSVALNQWMKLIQQTVDWLLMKNDEKLQTHRKIVSPNPSQLVAYSFIDRIGEQCGYDRFLLNRLSLCVGLSGCSYCTSCEHVAMLLSLITCYQTLKQSCVLEEICFYEDNGKNIFLRFMILAKILLESTADVNDCDCHGNTTLHIAAKGLWWSNDQQHFAEDLDEAAIVHILVKHRANIKAANKSGETPLQWAISGGRQSLALLMLQLDTLWRMVTYEKDSLPEHLWPSRNDVWKDKGIVSKLLNDLKYDIHSNVTQLCRYGSLLYHAVHNCQENAVDGLLSVGADINGHYLHGLNVFTPVTLALRKQKFGILAVIKKHSPMAISHHFHKIFRSNSFVSDTDYKILENQIIRPILTGGEKVDWKNIDSDKNSILHSLVSSSDDEHRRNVRVPVPMSLINLLIENGVPINAKNRRGFTALHFVMLNFKKYRSPQEVTQFILHLLQKGANVEEEDSWQMTPFHYICYWPKDLRKSFLEALPDDVETRVWEAVSKPSLIGIRIPKPHSDPIVCDSMGNTKLHVAYGVYGWEFGTICSTLICSCMPSFHSPANMECQLNDDGFLREKNKNGRPAIHYDYSSNKIAQLNSLSPSLLTETDNFGRNLWHLLAIRERSNVLAKLIGGIPRDQQQFQRLSERGAFMQDMYGRNPIHYFAMNFPRFRLLGATGSIKVIIETLWMASCSVKDIYHRTAFDYAQLKDTELKDVINSLDSLDFLERDRKKIEELRAKQIGAEMREADRITLRWHLSEPAVEKWLKSGDNLQQYVSEWSCTTSAERVGQAWKLCSANARTKGTMYEEIKSLVDQIMEKISERSGLKYRVLSVGSGYENTNLPQLADFDFNIELVELTSLCEVDLQSLQRCPPGFISLKRATIESVGQVETNRDKSNDTLTISHHNVSSFMNFDRFFDSDGILDTAALKTHFIHLLTMALHDKNLWLNNDRFEMIELSPSNSYDLEHLGINLMLKVNKPVNDEVIEDAISIDIVPVIRVRDWWPDDVRHLNERDRSAGCLLTLNQPCPGFERVDSLPLNKCAKISFACIDSRAIRRSPSVIRAAYMVAKYLNTINKCIDFRDKLVLPPYNVICRSYVLKCAALHISHLVQTKDGDEEIDIEKLRLTVELLLTKVREFQQQGFVPLYHMESMKIPVFEFEKYVGHARAVFDDHMVPYPNLPLMKQRQTEGMGMEILKCILQTSRYLWLVSSGEQKEPHSSPDEHGESPVSLEVRGGDPSLLSGSFTEVKSR